MARRRNAPPTKGDKWMSLLKAATALGNARQTVLKMAARGDVESMEIDGRTFVARADVDRVIRERKEEAAEAA